MVAVKQPLQPWYLAADAETGFSQVGRRVVVVDVRQAVAVAALQPAPAVAAQAVDRLQAVDIQRAVERRAVDLQPAQLAAVMPFSEETLCMVAR
jgi:hypothetical protein